MRIKDIYARGFGLSFEIFPPKTAQGDESLFEHLEKLKVHRPAFISCTYGAGGSTRSRTIELCQAIQDRFGSVATAHFTCVGSTVEDLEEWLRLVHSQGIRNIMALRGDPPVGQTEFKAVEGGLKNANELVSLIRKHYPDTGIGVAGYPEKHLEAPDYDIDLANLKRKVDAGADAVFTQLFFVNDHYFRFRDKAAQLGINIPLVPGIMPITEFSRIQRIVKMCGTDFPPELYSKLEAAQEDKEAQFEIGVDFAIQQCRQLMDKGVPGIHFYVLNKSEAVERILDGLAIKSCP
ncbi:methylenetetrahydrofolate reductase [NAD(P)H] [Planctomicrobium sp. SH661]|uniref:methylenetetrahydrofolate reductase [NAD(P)H] n=1 Tax=Planctomicrobium sp. SH661 TaxID=3448124 RepID=UPI003F5CB9F9